MKNIETGKYENSAIQTISKKLENKYDQKQLVKSYLTRSQVWCSTVQPLAFTYRQLFSAQWTL